MIRHSERIIANAMIKAEQVFARPQNSYWEVGLRPAIRLSTAANRATHVSTRLSGL